MSGTPARGNAPVRLYVGLIVLGPVRGMRGFRDEARTIMRTPNKVIEIGAWLLEHGHRALLALSGGRFPRSVLGMKPVELRTVGRKSGEWRATMLSSPVCDEQRVILVASKGGHQEHPQWYRNLVVNPDVEVTVDDVTRPMRARTASPAEKAALWPQIVDVYKGYDGYQRNTTRDIPVVICEPQPSRS